MLNLKPVVRQPDFFSICRARKSTANATVPCTAYFYLSLFANLDISYFFHKSTVILPTAFAAVPAAAAAVLSEQRAERPGGVRGEGGAVVGGAAGGDEEEVVRRHQQRLQQEVGGGPHEGVDKEPAICGNVKGFVLDM